MTTGSMRPAPKEFRIASVLSKLPFIVPCSSCSRWNKFKSSLARSQYSFTFQHVDVVVDDENTEVVAADPGASIREELGEPEGAEEDVEAALPDASAVAAPGHVADDPKEVGLT